MTATADGEGAGAENGASADAAYFRAIEDAFVRLRGAPLLLAPVDFQVASGWRRAGVPLGLVVATLEEVFAKRRERGTKGRINSLRYCAPAVEQAWVELRELQGPARRAQEPAAPAGEPVAVAERLADLAAALPGDLPDRDRAAARLAALADRPPEGVEEGLRALDAELLAAAAARQDAVDARHLDAEVEAIVDGLRERFPADELATLRGQLRRQRLRRRVGLPTLTLF